jgi:hypothetical protein
VVQDDVLAFARELGGNGLLDGVALPRPESDLPDLNDLEDWQPPAPLEVGDELDDFTLPDLEGNSVSLSNFRGRQVLLVNWSPGCGFCVKIAAALGRQVTPLAAEGIDLVLVTQGDADANRSLREDADLRAPTLLRGGTAIDPFRGTGTPAAYFIDEEGRLAEPMVVGADQVPLLVEELAGVAAPVVDEELPDGVLYLPAPGAMCGPGGGAGTSSTAWAGTRAYRVGDHHVGVRYNSDTAAEVLDRLFPSAQVDDRRVPDNYSVALHTGPTAKSRELNLLVHGSTQLVRSRSAARVLAGLLAYVSNDLVERDPELLRVSATAAVHEGDALLLPVGLVQWVKQLQPRFSRRGVTMVDVPYADLDLATGELVVPEPAIEHDATLLAELDDGVHLGSELPWTRPGRYPLRWWFLVRSPQHLGPLSPAIAVTAALPTVVWEGELQDAVVRLAHLFEQTRAVGLWYESAADLVDQVAASLR